MMGDVDGFHAGVGLVIQHVDFSRHAYTVQVFESTIRMMGGLLACHLFLTDPKHNMSMPGYRDELLNLAHDLGKRLMPAFNTTTGIPYARVNLIHGVVDEETSETCSAGAGSLLLEFGVLSRLVNDSRFEQAASASLHAIWKRRSSLDLIGNVIDVQTGEVKLSKLHLLIIPSGNKKTHQLEQESIAYSSIC